LACLLMWCPCTLALNSALDVSQYAHTTWKIRDGFAKGSILSIAQTPDGYIWLGTALGLSRFDGVRVTLWQPPPDQHLPSNTVTRLVAGRDGTLWIGTRSGLASWKNSKLTQYAELDGLQIRALVEDHEGSIWVGTNGSPGPPNGKLCEMRNGGIQCHPEIAGVTQGVYGLHEDGKGNLWVGLETGVWRWKPGPAVFYAVPGLLSGRIQSMVDGDDGALLIPTTVAIMRLADGKSEEVFSLPAARPGFPLLKMLRDRDGGLWVGPAGRGIIHLHQGRTDGFSQSDGLSGNDIYDMFQDSEGNIWVATVNGLDRFHELSVVTYSRSQGLSDIPWGGVLAATDGSVWVANLDGLNRLNQGLVTAYREHRTRADVPEIVGSGLPEEGVGSLFQDSRGRIWISTLTGIGYLENDRFIPTVAPGGSVDSLTEDTSGNLWIANRDVGLFRLSRNNEFQQIPWAAFGRQSPAVVLASDPLHGGVWLGFSDGGITWFRDGEVHSSFSGADGLGKGRVNDLRFDDGRALWIATEGGLSRLKNSRIATLTGKNGLPCDAVQWTIEDAAQSVWLMMPCGLVRVARSELDAWAIATDKTPRTIRTTVFDSSDGLRGRGNVLDHTPRVSKSADGKLWFGVPDGVSVVDPRHLPFNNFPPPVHIEQITADHKTYDASSNLRLPPLARDLEIDYTALSLVAPEKNLFRYKLEGYDLDWQSVGNRRQAFYTNLSPGNYRFRVVASNNRGVWNEQGAELDFFIAPAFWQTTWFRAVFGAAFLLTLWALYQLRLRQIRQAFNARLEERVSERTRIARELHDTLMQSTQGLILTFQGFAGRLTQVDPMRKEMEGALDQADDLLNEARDRVVQLRTTPPGGDLAAAMDQIGQEILLGSIIRLSVKTEGNRKPLQESTADEICLIAREAIYNARRHAGAELIELSIIYERTRMRITVKDNGRGIDPLIVEQDPNSEHFGIKGMRERAHRIGAELEIRRGASGGTEAVLIVPAKSAYVHSSLRMPEVLCRHGRRKVPAGKKNDND
jgi:signal transduction histidine kinase/ligand-binding sensor domain-containing protein